MPPLTPQSVGQFVGQLVGQVAIVTGSSRGIGAQIARLFASEGAKVVVNYAGREEAANATVKAIADAGGEAIAVKANVAQSAEVKALFDAAIQQWGKVDILVNNAGVILYKPIATTTDADFDRLLDINVKGTFYALREAANRLANGGRIINFSSTTTRLMLPTYGAYVATKGAVEQMTRIAAKELGARKIRVNVVSPGPVNTELFTTGKSEEDIKRMGSMAALGRIGEPDEIAKVVLFLASESSAWVTGQNLGANGGLA